MKPILESCGGMDVHRDQVTACICYGSLANAEENFIVKEFSTMTEGLKQLAMWFKEYHVKTVAMESTGIFWKPIFNILEYDFKVILANAARVKNVPGLKTDKKDARWLAKLVRYGLVPASFIPPRNIRELRDLTRTRRKLTEEMTRQKNRVQKTLQDANIKLSSVMTDVFGVSGDAMVRALLEKDEFTQEDIESMAKGKLKKKTDLLMKAMDGRVTEHHRFLLITHFKHIDFLAKQISEFDKRIYSKLEPYRKEFEDIQTAPGLNKVNAASVIAEIGTNMSHFPDENHLSSWAAICPGNNESAGKRKSGKTRRGNNYLKATLTEAAWAASRTKDTAISEKYHNIARRRGKKRAIVAVGHQLLKDIYHILDTGEPYRERDIEAVKLQKQNQKEQSMVRELEKMGYTIQKATATI
jgi:transposase